MRRPARVPLTPPMQFSETTTRILVAAVGIPAAVAVIHLGGWALGVVLAVLAALSALEFYRLAGKRGVEALRWLGAATAVVFVGAAALNPAGGPNGAGFGAIMVVATLIVGAACIWTHGVDGQPLLAASATVTGAIYTGATLSFGLFLRHLPGVEGVWHGTALVLAPIVLTWASDTFAFFTGRAIGRRKLIPKVSPGKTVEGALGAVVGTVAVGVGVGYALGSFPTYSISPWQAALFGGCVSVVAQIGDLTESVLKRDAGVKDSGALLPGHGGALDRLDSLFYTLPLGYFFFRYVIGSPQPF